MLAKLPIVLMFLVLPACNVTLKKYDQETVVHVDRTIEARERDFDRARQIVELVIASTTSPAVADQARRGLLNLEVLQKSELSRLRSFRQYEADKEKGTQ